MTLARFSPITPVDWQNSIKSARLRRASIEAASTSPKACAARAHKLLERRLNLIRTHGHPAQPQTAPPLKEVERKPPTGADFLSPDSEL